MAEANYGSYITGYVDGMSEGYYIGRLEELIYEILAELENIKNDKQ